MFGGFAGHKSYQGAPWGIDLLSGGAESELMGIDHWRCCWLLSSWTGGSLRHETCWGAAVLNTCVMGGRVTTCCHIALRVPNLSWGCITWKQIAISLACLSAAALPRKACGWPQLLHMVLTLMR